MALSDNLKKRIELIEHISLGFDEMFENCVSLIVESVTNGGTLFFAGNGGSAAEAQHMSAEYLATLDHRNFRPGIRAIALSVDTSFLTAWTNDFGYDQVFSRQLETLANPGDIFFAYTTSGNSKNIVAAAETANRIGVKTISFTGRDGGTVAKISPFSYIVPSMSTMLIQEIHTAVGHELCAKVERQISLITTAATREN